MNTYQKIRQAIPEEKYAVIIVKKFFPGALVETLFISNLEEEARIIDPLFQDQVAEKIFLGITDFLAEK